MAGYGAIHAPISLNMRTKDLVARDRKYIITKPDMDESAIRRHNDAIVEKTIRETDELRKAKQKNWDKKFSEHSDMLATYLRSLASGKTSLPADRYFGKRELARLHGEKIVEELKGQRLVKS